MIPLPMPLKHLLSSALKMGPLGYILLSFGFAACWTLVGLGLCLIMGDCLSFSREWMNLQGSFQLIFGFILFLMAFSGSLEHLTNELALPVSSAQLSNRCKYSIILAITLVGASSLIALGFDGEGIILFYMWTTCILVCFLASVATAHSISIVKVSIVMHQSRPALYNYSPADTPGLRRFASHVGIYGLVISLGYLITLVATLLGSWRGGEVLIRTVQVFWPLIYVPLCLITLSIPHISIYKVVRQEKDYTLLALQAQVFELSKAKNLQDADIERINSLADLIQKIEAAPNYPQSLRMLGVLSFTAIINIGSLFLPKAMISEVAMKALFQ